MGDTAKALNLPGIGRNTLFEILRDKNILMENNLPYQDYINRGWFEVKITPKTQKGVVVNYPTTMVLPKGLEKIRELLNRKVAA
jgi:anti-repressor protein